MRVTKRGLGQSGTEYTLLISVAVIGVVYAAYTFVRPFENGVNDLGRDVRDVLMGQSIGGVGRDGGSNANGSPAGGAPGPSGTNNGTGTMNTNTNIYNTTLNSPVTRDQQEQINQIRTMQGEPITYNVRNNGGNV